MPLRFARLATRVAQAALVVLAYVVDFLSVDDARLRFGGAVPVPVLQALAVPVFLALLVRRRHPRVVLAVALGWSVLAAALVPDYEPFTAVLVALYSVSARAARHEAVLWLLAVAPLVVLNSLNAVGPGARATDFGLAAVLWAVIVGIDWTAGRLTYRSVRTSELREAALVAEASLAVQRERLRLAREMHDVVANTVSAMVMQAAGARAVAPQSSADPVLRAIEESGVRAMRELRGMLALLRSDGDADDPAAGQLAGELDQLIAHARTFGVVVDLAVEGEPAELDTDVDHAVRRIVGECLANAAKHGGVGTHVHLRLRWDVGTLRVTAVSRRGRGGPPTAVPGSGYGLVGIAERVASLGGSVTHGEQAGGEFVVDAELPVVPRPRTTARPAGVGETVTGTPAGSTAG